MARDINTKPGTYIFYDKTVAYIDWRLKAQSA